MPKILTSHIDPSELSEHNAKMFGSPKERLDFYRREIQYETIVFRTRVHA
ncbi:hypothetical protein PMHK_13710 [Pseudomonas sp. MHK4]